MGTPPFRYSLAERIGAGAANLLMVIFAALDIRAGRLAWAVIELVTAVAFAAIAIGVGRSE